MTTRVRVEGMLDAAAPVVVAACVLAAAAASSIPRDLLDWGRPARWALLAVFLAYGLTRAALCGRAWRFPLGPAAALVAFCGLALVSTAWSVNGRGTLERAIGVTAVVVAAGALAGCVPSSPRLASRLLDGVFAGAAVVAVAGFVYWLVAPSDATIAATTEYPSRYQGIEQNPNTAPLLLAVGMPLALSRALRARDPWRRVAFAFLLLGFVASISASASRGGLLGGVVGLCAVIAFAPLARGRRVALAVLGVLVLAVAVWAMTIPKALPAASAPPPSASRDAETTLPLSQELGNPWWTHGSGGSRRSLLNTSVRLRALRGTVGRALARPILGYGFGAEQWAFVNRYYAFDSENPENGYVGILLQVGLAGLAVFLATLAACVVPGIRACLRCPRDDVAVAALGATAAGLALGISQSFFHGPGSIVYVAFWISLLLATVANLVRFDPRAS